MATTTAKLKPATEPDAAEPVKKSKKKLMIIVVAVLVLGGGGYYKFGMKKGAPPAPKAGVVVPLEAITINLSGGHFLKLGLALQATTLAKEPPDGSEALDLAIEAFSNRPVAELSSNKGRAVLKAELSKKVTEAYKDEVMGVYFTQFVMQ
jgi:flagellar FliL protein